MTQTRSSSDLRDEIAMLRGHRDVLNNLARLASGPAVGREEFFQEIANRVADAVEIDHVKLLRFRRDRGDLLLEAGVGWKPGLVKSAAYPADMASHVGKCFQTGLTVRVDNFAQSEFRIDPSLADHGIVSLMNVAIPVDGLSWGVLEIDSTVRRTFSQDTENFVAAVASIVGLMVQRMRAERIHTKALVERAAEVQRRTLLLNEMQHRVKNNFQMILAMIELQQRNSDSDDVRRITARLTESVIAMSLAHNQLSPDQAAERLNLASYLRTLTASIEKPIEGVTLEVEANEMDVGIDQAVPIGLIVNEAVTNAVKHAFGPDGGSIRIELLNQGYGEAVLTVCDNGRGMAVNADGGSGQHLMDALARQLRGRVERDANPKGGAIIRVVFPRPLGAAGPQEFA
jgi:two-component sensor histidine kinase